MRSSGRASASTAPRPWPRTDRPGCRLRASCGTRRLRRRSTSAIAPALPRAPRGLRPGSTTVSTRLLYVLVRQTASGHRRFVGSLLTFVVGPTHRDLVAGFGALDRELQERVLRHGGAPLGVEHRLAVVRRTHLLDE